MADAQWYDISEKSSDNEGADGRVEHVFDVVKRREFDADQTLNDVRLNSGLPEIGDLYGATRAALRRKAVRREVEGESRVWRAELRYSFIGHETSPLSEDPVVRFDSAQYTRAQDAAWQKDGDAYVKTKPIRNAAGDPFDPPPEEVETRTRIEITRNYWEYFSPAAAQEFANTINERPMLIAGVNVAKFQAKIVQVYPERWAEQSNIAFGFTTSGYLRVRWIIEIHPESFESELLNQGYNYLDSDGNRTRASVSDADGAVAPATEPILLAADGTELASDAEPVYLPFVRLRPRDWGYLQLPEEDPTLD
jgi:hypothetical protein